MKETEVVDRVGSSQVRRREFLKDGLLLTSTVIFGLRQVVAEARVAGKPPFTAANLNSWCASRSEKEYRDACQEVARDLKAFVRNTFYLTPEQDSALTRIPPEVQQKIVALVNGTLEQGSRFRMVVNYVQANKPLAAPQGSTQRSTGLNTAGSILSVRSQQEEVKRLQSAGKKAEASKLAQEAKEAKDTGFFEKLIGTAGDKAND